MTAIAALPKLHSLGCELDSRPEAFGFITDSNDILDQPEALRARLEEDGYLYIRNFFDPELILAGRRSIFRRIAAEGQLDPDHDLMDGVVHPDMLDAFKLDTAPTFKESDGKNATPTRWPRSVRNSRPAARKSSVSFSVRKSRDFTRISSASRSGTSITSGAA